MLREAELGWKRSAGEGSSDENGTWITYDSKLSNLGKSPLEIPNLKMGVELYISAEDLGRTFVATVNTNSVKSEDQDERYVLECQRQLILLECAARAETLVRRRSA